MRDDTILLLPGPTKVPDRVQRAMARQMINHRGASFRSLYKEIRSGLQELFGTDSAFFILPSSGTGAMESAIVNLFSPGDVILCVVMGVFGERFAQIAAAHGMRVQRLEVRWGAAPASEEVVAALKGGDFRGLLLTHNETSTGVSLDLAGLLRSVREAGFGGRVVVDAISSMGAIPLGFERWGIDVVVGGSQKALMCPPGLGIVCVAPGALGALAESSTPRYYLDLRPYAGGDEIPYTPAISLLYALREALEMMREEGIENICERHRCLGRLARDLATAVGLGIFAEPGCESNSVGAFEVPRGMDGVGLRRDLEERYRLVVAGGQGPLKGRIIRMGHMGAVTEGDVREGFERLKAALGEKRGEAR